MKWSFILSLSSPMFSIINWQIDKCSFEAATWSGVIPIRFPGFLSSEYRMIKRQFFKNPFWAAHRNGVFQAGSLGFLFVTCGFTDNQLAYCKMSIFSSQMKWCDSFISFRTFNFSFFEYVLKYWQLTTFSSKVKRSCSIIFILWVDNPVSFSYCYVISQSFIIYNYEKPQPMHWISQSFKKPCDMSIFSSLLKRGDSLNIMRTLFLNCSSLSKDVLKYYRLTTCCSNMKPCNSFAFLKMYSNITSWPLAAATWGCAISLLLFGLAFFA